MPTHEMPLLSSRALYAGALTGLVPALLTAWACGATPDRDRASRVDLGTAEAVASPATGGATSQQLTNSNGRMILSWLESADFRTTLRFAERTGAGWSEPRLVSVASDIVTNAADVPSVRALADGTLIAHWLEEDGPDPESYRLPLSWSKDGGLTWSAPTTPHHDGTQTQHGFGTTFQAADGGLGVVWLDGRATRGGGDIGLWSATFDRSAKQTGEATIEPRACECCQTSVAQTSEGPIVAFRGRSADETRDIQVARFAEGRWSAPAVVHNDGWQIEGCPVNGPAVTARAQEVAVAWFTAATGDGHAFVAFSGDAGRTFQPPIRIDDGSATGRVDAELLADGSVAVSWTEFVNDQQQVRLRRVDSSGSRTPSQTIGTTTGMQYPRLAQGADELIVTWSESENLFPRVRTARVPLTRQ